MKLIKPSYEIIEPTGYTIDDIYKSIELAGRVSHKSEDKITETSAKDFVERMLNMKHLATCEFGTVYLECPENVFQKYINNKYSRYKYIKEDIQAPEEYSSSLYYHQSNEYFYVTTNLRVLVENNWMDDLKYICEPTEYHEKRICVKFICDRAIANEFVRHRKFSFLQESTRYCNYSKDKFNNELIFIKPCWADESLLKDTKRTIVGKNEYGSLIYEYYYHPSEKAKKEMFGNWVTPERNFIVSLQIAEQLYLELLIQGWKPEQARNILPLSLKTELYMCGFISDWKKFFELRCASNAHPQARELAIPLQEKFIDKGIVVIE